MKLLKLKLILFILILHFSFTKNSNLLTKNLAISSVFWNNSFQTEVQIDSTIETTKKFDFYTKVSEKPTGMVQKINYKDYLFSAKNLVPM